MKCKKILIPLILFFISCFFSITTFAAGSFESSDPRLYHDRFSFDASSSQGNILLVSNDAFKRFEDWEVGVTPESYSGNYNLASVYAARLSWDSSGNKWVSDHQATDVKYFSSSNFTLNYLLYEDASSSGTFRLQCYSNGTEFGIGGWWEP